MSATSCPHQGPKISVVFRFFFNKKSWNIDVIHSSNSAVNFLQIDISFWELSLSSRDFAAGSEHWIIVQLWRAGSEFSSHLGVVLTKSGELKVAQSVTTVLLTESFTDCLPAWNALRITAQFSFSWIHFCNANQWPHFSISDNFLVYYYTQTPDFPLLLTQQAAQDVPVFYSITLIPPTLKNFWVILIKYINSPVMHYLSFFMS